MAQGGIESLISESSAAKKKRWATVVSILIGVLLLHVAAGVVAGVFIVAKYIFPPPANFEVKRDIRLPAKKREHKMNMAAMDAMAPKPALSEKMQSTRPTEFPLPDVPPLPLDQMLPLDPSELVSDQMTTLSGAEALGNSGGLASGGSGGFGNKGMSFLGVQSTGQRILMVFDVSSSVVTKAEKAGVPLSKIQSETASLIEKLPITSKFGIIQFTQNYKAFTPELVPATDNNRKAAFDWIQNEWVTTGSMASSSKTVTKNPRGFAGVLEVAAAMKPDVVFVISDGSFQWKPPGGGGTIPWDVLRKIIEGPLQEDNNCKVNFITFEATEQDTKELKRISTKTGGKTLEMK